MSGAIKSKYAIGKTTAEMKNFNTFIASGWNESIWTIDPTGRINDGYQYLRRVVPD